MNKLAVAVVVVALVLVAGYFLMQSKNNPYSKAGSYHPTQNSYQNQVSNGPVVSDDVNAELNNMEKSMSSANPSDFNDNLDPSNL